MKYGINFVGILTQSHKKGGVVKNTQKPNNTLTTVTVDLDKILEQFEKQEKTIRRLTFSLFACASYIVISNLDKKQSIKQKFEDLNKKKGE